MILAALIADWNVAQQYSLGSKLVVKNGTAIEAFTFRKMMTDVER